MADLAASDVVVNKVSSATLSNGLTRFEKECTVTLAVHGDATSGQKILATAFGLSSFSEVSNFTKSDDTEVIPAAPAADKTFALLRAAATQAPATTSGTYKCVVKGY